MIKLREVIGYDLREIVPESAIEDEAYVQIYNDSISMYGNKPLMDFEMMYKQLEEWREKYYTCHVPRHFLSEENLSILLLDVCMMRLYWENGFIEFGESINVRSSKNGWLNDSTSLILNGKCIKYVLCEI